MGGASFLWCLLWAECEALGCSQVPWASDTTFWGGTSGRKMGISSLMGNWVIIDKAGDSGRQEEDGGGGPSLGPGLEESGIKGVSQRPLP